MFRVKHILYRLRPVQLSQQLKTFMHDESIGGKLILGTALLSMIIVNSPLADSFESFWHTKLTIGIGSWSLALDLRHWLNEGLMAFFFLVVGLEIKRELVRGELRDIRAAILPIGAAIGGMILPAAIYLFFNAGTEAQHGWGIPIATDIAFAAALLSLLSKHVPPALKIFLLTLAIADDIGAITVIALFYAEIINYWYLSASVGLVITMLLSRRFLISRFGLVVLLGGLLWVTTHLSGIHASIVGAIMGFLAPIPAREGRRSVAEKAELFFLPITTFLILPLFALANAGFTLSREAFQSNNSVMLGIIGGLVLGKFLGVLLACILLVKTKVAVLPSGVGWFHVSAAGFIAGIGFTVSIFITELAFPASSELVTTAKAAIFIASILSACLGGVILSKARILRNPPFRRLAATDNKLTEN